MAASTNTPHSSTADSVKQLRYLAGALKAPRVTEAATRLADQARDAGWSFEDYLAAVLVQSREAVRNSRTSGTAGTLTNSAGPSQSADWRGERAARTVV